MNNILFPFFIFIYHRHFTEVYRKECLATAVKLLERICKGAKQAVSNPNCSDIPVACMNLVASVSDSVYCLKQQVCFERIAGFQTEISYASLKYTINVFYCI